VSKQGFEDQPAKTATLKKGEDTRLEFKLKPAVQVSSLEIVGAAPGTEVRIDQKMLGTVGSDGGLKNASIPPGSHSIELSRSQFNPRSSTRNFVAGQTVTLSGLDVQLAEKAPTPPPPVEAPKPPPPAPKPAPVVASAPAPRTLLMDSFEDPSQWKEDNGVFRHKGKGFFAYKVPAKGGVLTTNIYLIRGGGIISGARLRWRVNQTDEKNYTEFNLDDDTLYTRDFVNGKSTDQKKKHNIPSKDKKDKVWAIKIDLSSDKVVTQMQKDQDWITIDTFAPAGRNLLDGKFGFWIQGGGDEMGLSDLTFKPR
jgi:hypothetical protein